MKPAPGTIGESSGAAAASAAREAAVTLAVLAGGAGSRMGTAKTTLRIGGQPVLEYLLNRLAWHGPTLLVTAPGRERPIGHEAFNHEAVDAVGGEGPLRGILTALELSSSHPANNPVVFVPLDMLAMQREPLRWLAEQLQAKPGAMGIMTQRGGDSQPFPSIFRPELAEPIRRRLESGARSVRALADEDGVIVLPAPASWPPSVWTNVNSPADFDRFIKEMTMADPSAESTA
jgi:molybdenum cofactor guanylyltransferase